MDKNDVVLKIIDVITGRHAALSDADADEMREVLAPGSTAPALSQAEQDQLAQLQARQAANEAANSPAPAAEVPVEEVPDGSGGF